MKALITSVSFFFAALSVTAQNDDYYKPAATKIKLEDRVSGSVMAGTSLGFSGNKNTSLSTFIAPKLNYKISDRFSFTAGLMHYTMTPGTTYRISNNESVMNYSNRNASGNMIFAGAEYKMNKKLLVCGAFMMDTKNRSLQNNNYKAISFGMDYKLSEHSSIGFRATVSQGSTDYIFDPNRGSYNYNPVTGNTFGNMMGGFSQWGVDELNHIK
jgi:hypothetical protein